MIIVTHTYVIDELRKHHDNQQLYYANAIEQTRTELRHNTEKVACFCMMIGSMGVLLSDYDEYVKDLKVDKRAVRRTAGYFDAQ